MTVLSSQRLRMFRAGIKESKLDHLAWLDNHLDDENRYPPVRETNALGKSIGGDDMNDGNPKATMRARMKAAEKNVKEDYNNNIRRKSKGGTIIGGSGADTPREEADNLDMLNAAPRGLKEHLKVSGINDVRTERGLSLLSRQETRKLATKSRPYIPIRDDAFREKMAKQHRKMIKTFDYQPPAEKPKIIHKKNFDHQRRMSLMTRNTKRKFDSATEAVTLLTRKGNGWVVNWRTRQSALDHMVESGTAALTHIEEVVTRLQDQDWGVRASAAKVMAAIGEAAEPYAEHIVNILEDENPTVRSAALHCLPKLGGDVARLHWKKVVHALEHDDSDKVRNTAFKVIREMCLMKPGADREKREADAQAAKEAQKEEEMKKKLQALRGGNKSPSKSPVPDGGKLDPVPAAVPKRRESIQAR